MTALGHGSADPEHRLESLIGHRLPGGELTVEAYEDWLLRDVVLGDPATDGSLHPLWAFAGLQRAIGISIDELFHLCQASADDGPVLGDTQLELIEPMVVGDRYRVTAEISDVQRKQGRRAGTIDVVWLRAQATDHEGRVMATLVNSYIFRRSPPS